MQWSIFCRVVDNFGDIGFAWRLAADLGARGEAVRFAADDPTALAWMAPHGAPGVEVIGCNDAGAADSDVLVETFGCGFPPAVQAKLDSATVPPVCIDVEHLSAEPYARRSHGLPSPRFTAQGAPRPTWFFYPGFDEGTGGLLREPGLLEQRQSFGDGRRWLAARGIETNDAERRVSLFCYRNPALDALLDALAAAPTLVLLTPGPATEQARALLGPGLQRGLLRAATLPALAQADYDRLLWSCDLNLVRGEDSLVRALWAGAPFLWQIYPQDDGAHAAKLQAFLDAFLRAAPAGLATRIRQAFSSWNGLGATAGPARFDLPEAGPWAAHCRGWRDQLAARRDLTGSLLEFAASKR
ncbi:MAG: elongation factor P maturation arginine rhamnosyltransferase EarP [Caldimonas sp.]